MCNFWTSFVIKICLQARKVIFSWPFEKQAPWSIHYAINNNDRSSEKTFCFKIYRQSVCFLLLLLLFFFLSSTELHEVNNYDTNLSTEANASTPRYGPVPYFVLNETNQHGGT